MDQTHGFAIGVDILHGLAQRPQYPVEAALRALWFNMIEMDVPFAVLTDLLGELPNLWPEHDGIGQLQTVLLEFLSYLQLPPTERETKRKVADPDLTTTLEALAEALPIKTRHRLGLLSKV